MHQINYEFQLPFCPPIHENGLMTAKELQIRLRAAGNPDEAAFLSRFFKTGPGQYGHGDVMIGVRVPVTRAIARDFRDLPLREVERLLHSKIHEERLAALILLVERARAADDKTRRVLYELYLANAHHVNNWDLVDVSASDLVGAYLEHRSRRPIYRLAKSESLWERRIAVLATLHFIRRGDFADTLALARRLLHDREDLIHKAVGWMLREVGKRDEAALTGFLDRHAAAMPRTMLRYAIEKFPPAQRQRYLAR